MAAVLSPVAKTRRTAKEPVQTTKAVVAPPTVRITAVEGVAPTTTLICQYGVRLEQTEEARTLLQQQYNLAHRLYNEMVAHSRSVFDRVMAVLEAHDARIKQLQERIDGLYESRRGARAIDNRDQYAALTKEISALWKERAKYVFDARRNCREKLDPLLAEINVMRSSSVVYGLRTRYVKEEGLYWGTAGAIMTAFANAWKKQWPRLRTPHFRKASERTRRVLVDPMNDRPGGLTQEELFSGRYRLALGRIGTATKRLYAPFCFRAGPNGQELTGTVQWHRELPEGARVTEARLVEESVARNRRYFLQLQIRLAEPPTPIPKADRGVAGLALGWYRDGETRRVGAINETTLHEKAEIIRLPQNILDDLNRAEEWQSARDIDRDKIYETLKQASAALAVAPETIRVRTDDLLKLPAAHVAPNRLAGVCLFWRDAHSDFRPDLLATLEAWRKLDAERWERISHVRRRALKRRRDFYNTLAVGWVARFHTIILHELDLAGMAHIKDEHTGEHNELGAKARSGRYVAALSELLAALKRVGSRSGTMIVMTAAGTAYQCSACGTEVAEIKERVQLPCSACGEDLERRANASANLRRLFDAMGPEIEAMADESRTKHQEALDRRSDMRLKRSQKRAEAAARRRAEKTAK